MARSDKNAFQWDAYRPLIDRIPACNVQGVYPSMHRARGCLPGGCLPGECLPREICLGVSAQGVSAKKGDVYPWKVSAQGGVCRGREVSA